MFYRYRYRYIVESTEDISVAIVMAKVILIFSVKNEFQMAEYETMLYGITKPVYFNSCITRPIVKTFGSFSNLSFSAINSSTSH